MKRREFLAYAVVTPLLVACRTDSIDPTSAAPGAVSLASANLASPSLQCTDKENAIFSSGGYHDLTWDNTGSWYMDKAPFQFFAAEIHPARVPSQYWEHRIKMIKAMGCNTISLYIMWNFHEQPDGSFDFSSPDKDIGHFIDLCAKNNLWVLLRPGPYVCAEWDFGGLPPRMLADPKYRDSAGNLQIRGNFKNYMAAVNNFNSAVYQHVVKGRTIDAGGPIMLIAVENEYTSWSPDDTSYPAAIAQQWRNLGYSGKLCICDGYASEFKNRNITIPSNTAFGMTADGSSAANYATAAKNYGVGVFGAECYPGWICYWGDSGQICKVEDFVQQVSSLAQKKLSFVLYVGHGGTNFGFHGGRDNDGEEFFQPVITSYDYGAPVSESGNPNPNYFPIQSAFISSASYRVPFYPVPAGIPHIQDKEIPSVASDQFSYSPLFPHISLDIKNTQAQTIEWIALTLNKTLPSASGVYPSGVVIYQTKLPAAGGDITLTFSRPPDCALIFVNQKKEPNLMLSMVKNGTKNPVTSCLLHQVPANATLQIVCLPFGRAIHKSSSMNQDGRGLSGDIKANGVALKNWQMGFSPLSSSQVSSLPFQSAPPLSEQPFFCKTTINVSTPKDMFIDMSGWGMGYLFINGKNLGRYWPSAGPQTRLYCPGVWLNSGSNTIIVFEFIQQKSGNLSFFGSSGLPLNISSPTPAPGSGLVVSANTLYQIQNINSGLYLDVAGSNTNNSFITPSQQTLTGEKSQCWTFTQEKDGNYTIKNASTGGVLDVAKNRTTPGSAVIVFPANGGANQSWKVSNLNSNTFTLTGRQSQLLLDVSGALKCPTSGSVANIIISPEIKDSAGWPFSQQWRVIPVILNKTIYTIRNVQSNLLLGAYQGGSTNGTLLGIANATGGKEQQWLMTSTSSGIWQLTNVKSGLVMDVQGQSTGNGAKIELWSSNNGANQLFNLIPQMDGKSFTIRGVQSSRVLDVNNSGMNPTVYGSTPVSAITLWDGNGGANQSWIFTPVI